MPHDIIDNRASYLADAVRPLLNESVERHVETSKLAAEPVIICTEALV